MTADKNNKKDSEKKKTLSLSKGTLGLKSPGTLTPSSGSGSKSVTVEVKRKRTLGSGLKNASRLKSNKEDTSLDGLTSQEREARIKALEAAKKQAEIDAKQAAEDAKRAKEEDKKIAEEAKNAPPAEMTPEEKLSAQREKELEELKAIQKEEEKKAAETQAMAPPIVPPTPSTPNNKFAGRTSAPEKDTVEVEKKKRAPSRQGDDRRGGRLTVNQALNYEYEIEQRQRSLAAQRRARQKERRKLMQEAGPQEKEKQVRKVVVPEAITVQELAKRMAEKTADVIKFLMGMGVMATQNQSIDADTAELVISEFGHEISRVTEADVEIAIEDKEDNKKDMLPRAPVVTVMGHVDHGKTSILDALRTTDVAAGEAGGITQHIGAYQIKLESGSKITFLDTPGHAAFTEMRSRGANVTDIVVLVVAADDSVMPQTIEAINHSKAAGVPMIVAINKCDLEAANPQRVKEELLQHEVIVEDYSGDVQAIEVSAKQGLGLDKLEEAILLQAEMLELKANPNRSGRGTVVESKLDKGRGAVATVLVEKGTLKVGDIFITGQEWGKIRALVNDKGQSVEEAGPSLPVEVLGLNGAPMAGDDFVVVKSENEAREISEYRSRENKAKKDAAMATSVDQLFAQAKAGEKKKLSVILKADVQGSVEAIQGSLAKLTEDNDEIEVQILHSGVGEITEADITLANASNGFIVGFNVRANAPAREKAKRDDREIRYYSIIYNVIDDVKAILTGMLSPTLKEEFIGYAEIRQVFNITKVGKVAGCMVTDGHVKRGAKVRLLRDNVVIHEGTLKTLQRLKDEVKEVREGMECGMAFENYDDIKEGDMIECFEIKEEAKEL